MMVVRSSAGVDIIYTPPWGVIHVGYPRYGIRCFTPCKMINLSQKFIAQSKKLILSPTIPCLDTAVGVCVGVCMWGGGGEPSLRFVGDSVWIQT